MARNYTPGIPVRVRHDLGSIRLSLSTDPARNMLMGIANGRPEEVVIDTGGDRRAALGFLDQLQRACVEAAERIKARK